MNKNLLFGSIALIAVAIVAGLLLWEPEAKTPSFGNTTVKEEAKEFPQIAIKEKKEQKVRTAASSSKPTKPKKKIDPTIKAANIDHYGRYLIQLIDENPEDKDIRPSQNPKSYKYLEGKINGKQFVLKIPKTIIDSPNLKLRIIDLKTRKHTIINADFINEISSLPKLEQYYVDIDLDRPSDIQTKIIDHRDEATALPSLD